MNLFSFEIDHGNMSTIEDMDRGDGIAQASGDPCMVTQGYLSEIYLLLDQRFNTSFFITARTSIGLKGIMESSRSIPVAPVSFNKIGAFKFPGMIFLNIIQNMVEVERFRENQNHN